MLKNLYFYKSTKKIQYDTASGPVNLIPKEQSYSDTEIVKTYEFVGVLGIIKIPTTLGVYEYFVFVSDGDILGSMNAKPVYEIKKIKYLPLKGPSTCEEMDAIKNFIEDHSFYCTLAEIKDFYKWNLLLLNNFNSVIPKKKSGKNSKAGLFVKRSPFMTDTSMTENTVETGGSDYFVYSSGDDYQLCNLFCGYYEFQTFRNADELFNFEIRSFISTNRIGPRMLCRGVNEDGDVSFFVKTEFICKPLKRNLEHKIDKEFKFTIFRGSVPLYWSQDDPLKPSKINFDKTELENYTAFKNHFNNFTIDKEIPIVVDLLGHHKYESILSQMYREKCCKEKIKYCNFNLNAHVSNYSELKSALYEKLAKIQAPDTFCILDEEEDEISVESDTIKSIDMNDECGININTPKHDKNIVYRVNCLDCLDRTNLCQYLIFNYYNPYKFEVIKNMWKNNGNALAMLYTGSQALKSDFHKEKRRSLFSRVNDMVISANRMINNKFTDKDKQKVIDILLKGTYTEN